MTTFPEAIRLGFVNYVNFSGRSTRPEFWFWILFVALVNLAASLLDYAIGLAINGSNGGGAFSLFAVLAGLGLLLPNLAAVVRRLRDAGKPWANIFWGVGGGVIGGILEAIGFVLLIGAAAGAVGTALGGGDSSTYGALGGLFVVGLLFVIVGAAVALTGYIILIVKLCAPSVFSAPFAPVAPTSGYGYYS